MFQILNCESEMPREQQENSHTKHHIVIRFIFIVTNYLFILFSFCLWKSFSWCHFLFYFLSFLLNICHVFSSSTFHLLLDQSAWQNKIEKKKNWKKLFYANYYNVSVSFILHDDTSESRCARPRANVRE